MTWHFFFDETSTYIHEYILPYKHLQVITFGRQNEIDYYYYFDSSRVEINSNNSIEVRGEGCAYIPVFVRLYYLNSKLFFVIWQRRDKAFEHISTHRWMCVPTFAVMRCCRIVLSVR